MKRLYFSLIAMIAFVGFAALALADPGTRWNEKINGHHRFKVLRQFDGAAVLDKETGRVWEQSPSTDTFCWTASASCPGTGLAPDALSYCYQLQVGGRKGWRVPTIEELASLVDISQGSPTTPALPAGHPFNVQPTRTGRLLPTPAMPTARGPWASPPVPCSIPLRPPTAKCGVCAAGRGLMGFSDWVT